MHEVLILDKQVDSIDEAAFERVHVLLAVEAKMMLAMLAPACVLFTLNNSGAATCGNGTPAHIIHGCNRILNTELLVLFHHVSIQVQVLNVQVVETLLAISVWAAQLAHFPSVDLRGNHVVKALCGIVVFATGQELEFVAEKFAEANATLLFLTIELPSESLIRRFETLFKLPSILKLNSDISICVLSELRRVLFDQRRDQLALDDHNHFINGWAVFLPNLGDFLKNGRFELLVECAFQGNQRRSMTRVALDEHDGELDGREGSELHSHTLDLIFGV